LRPQLALDATIYVVEAKKQTRALPSTR
jgi:hypothetical protein